MTEFKDESEITSNLSNAIQIGACRILACCFVLVLWGCVAAAFGQTLTDISVGGVSLAIPNPNGFSPVTQQMTELSDLQRQFVAPTNEEFVAFIPERDVREVLKGNIPPLPRRFTVQTGKNLIAVSVPTSYVVELKNFMKSQNDEMAQKIEKQRPSMMKTLSEGIAKKYDVDFALSISHFVPMPVHEDTDRTFAYSMLVKFDVNGAAGNSAPYIGVVTVTVAHVKGKVLYLYSHAEKSGLEWSRKASKQWANAVVAANPSDLQASVKESLPSGISRFDWGKVGANSVVGAIIGGIAGLLGVAIRRGRAS